MDVYYITLLIVTLFKAKARVDFIFELDLTSHLVPRMGIIYLFWEFLRFRRSRFLVIFGVSLSSAGE